MAYNNRNHLKKVDFIRMKYLEWKNRNEDIPDTYFVRKILKELGHSMSYSAFMKGYKHKNTHKEKSVKNQLKLF
ncbi:hypothetical protein SAMN04515674_12171 [Pseudarcicella hirudinis]|uniref:Transposase n=1 Tax=Pseudarcicella hirudinis TaxID=1079859 RepID=A0A1I5YTY8_9BACT|nr:hypothetical protein [Pseudarcicella hirudinis]SFQ27357.1 hypothetical protein SAMN04515674_113157 [Pseudarcicella hirudinis]SFQ47704.1 hypothetical protein SAMN04515674_12171 [Pseudarcicella hirudinis]